MFRHSHFQNHKTNALETGDNASLNYLPTFNFSQIPIYPKSQIRLQPKLIINQPGDVYEQEADRIGEHMMRNSTCGLQRKFAYWGTCTKSKSEQ